MRHIAHYDLDSFFVSVERLKNPHLESKPLIIGSDTDRGVVASCSYETRVFGVRSAMPIKRAKSLCPEAIIIPGDRDAYSYYSNKVSDIIKQYCPKVEKASIDEHYIELSHFSNSEEAYHFTLFLKKHITQRTGLPISFGLASNKTVAKIGTDESKPNGSLHIPHGKEMTFLAPLSVSKIPMVGPKITQILKSMGITKIGQLQKLTSQFLMQVFGKNGYLIWERARGIDQQPVVTQSTRKSISKEHTFDADVKGLAFLHHKIEEMAENISIELRESGLFTGAITVKVRYENFETVSRQSKVTFTCDHNNIRAQAKFLLKLLIDHDRPVRLIGLKCSQLTSGSYQLDLFNQDITSLNSTLAQGKILEKFAPLI